MNIKDIKETGLTEGDMLIRIWDKQKELEDKYNEIEKKNGEDVPDLPLDIDSFRGQRRARAIVGRITEELYEATNCLRNKAWKQSQVPTDRDHFLEELSDAFHFFFQLFIELGLDPVDIYNLYFKKSEVNKFRQRTKY